MCLKGGCGKSFCGSMLGDWLTISGSYVRQCAHIKILRPGIVFDKARYLPRLTPYAVQRPAVTELGGSHLPQPAVLNGIPFFNFIELKIRTEMVIFCVEMQTEGKICDYPRPSYLLIAELLQLVNMPQAGLIGLHTFRFCSESKTAIPCLAAGQNARNSLCRVFQTRCPYARNYRLCQIPY